MTATLSDAVIAGLKAGSAPIVILTGAGISRESGLHTFRDADGIWAKYDLSEVATPEAFYRNPARVQDFYNARRRALLDPDIHDNAAHRAIAGLEATWPGEVLLVTQNINDLHMRGGSRSPLHMHGELLKSRCTVCGTVAGCRDDLGADSLCACGAVGTLRPHVVWFGEMPLEMDRIQRALTRCGLFIAIGTSGNVYPANSFVQLARQYGQAETIELNLEPSEGAGLFAHAAYGPATEIVPRFVARLLA